MKHSTTDVAEPSTAAGAGKAERYKAVVPDTLDLAERAALSVNALTGACDPKRDYEAAACAHMHHKPAHLSYRGGAGCHPKAVQVLPLMRLMSGSTLRADYDAPMLAWATQRVEADGVWWLKVDQTPWNRDMYKIDFHQPIPHVRLLLALLERHELDGDAKSLKLAERMAHGITKIVKWSEDRAWCCDYLTRDGCWRLSGPGYNVEAGKKVESEPEHPDIFSNGVNLRGLARWYAVSGDPQIRKTADGVARFMMKAFRGKDPDDFPSMIAGREHGFWSGHGHFHMHTHGMLGLAEYAIVTGDQDAARYVRGFYDYARLHGIARMGFFPAVIGSLEYLHRICRSDLYGHKAGEPCEGCSLGDITYMAVLMSEAGLADYWEDADQYVRNHLVEHQWVDRSLMQAVVDAHDELVPDPLFQWAGDEILDRLVGGFSSITDPTWNYGWYTQCCNANTPHGMYKAWSAIVRPQGDGVQVNLLLNRASPWMDIDSYLPYEGKVVLRNKTARWAAVRVPRWADRKQVRCGVNGVERPVTWLNNYLMLRDLAPTDVAAITFPMVRTVERYTEKVYENEYTLHLKGNTVVDISPREPRPRRINDASDDGQRFPVNTGYPIYQRDHYKSDKAPTKTVQRYVASKLV